MKGFDTHYQQRLNLLAELMVLFPRHPMRKLQKSALREFPVASRELYRHCMGVRFGFRAADIANASSLQGAPNTSL